MPIHIHLWAPDPPSEAVVFREWEEAPCSWELKICLSPLRFVRDGPRYQDLFTMHSCPWAGVLPVRPSNSSSQGLQPLVWLDVSPALKEKA